MTNDFSGKTAIVTGAGSGIGAAIARELALRGAAVMIADRDEATLEQVREAVSGAGGTVRAHRVDVANERDIEALVAATLKAFGGLDLAVNNAGIGGPSAATAEYPSDGWRQVLSVNLDGVFFGLKHQIGAMMSTGRGGAIVNMASILGAVGFANAPAYVASKHAVVGLTKTAAIEYAPHNIRINAVGPGFIDTPLVTKSIDASALPAIAAMHPMGRLGTVEEVSALTCFLLSDAAGFITGSYHLVDGGYVAR